MLVVEMLGATSTITYGLNIVCDPVHEPLEYEADAPGITKVGLSPQRVSLHSAQLVRHQNTVSVHVGGVCALSRWLE